jgi:tRNA (cytidine/uridine-2'-O-)-methyltransferase
MADASGCRTIVHVVDMMQRPRLPIKSSHIVQLALYQPDIAANFGAALRLCACLDVGLSFIEPCGFPLSDKVLRRVSLDYGDLVAPVRHVDFGSFRTALSHAGTRIIAVETGQATALHDFSFLESDVLLLGRETRGLPDTVLAACDGRVTIPMNPTVRSFNLVTAAAIALAEAVRQTRWVQGTTNLP